jgi:hypothetical protein
MLVKAVAREKTVATWEEAPAPVREAAAAREQAYVIAQEAVVIRRRKETSIIPSRSYQVQPEEVRSCFIMIAHGSGSGDREFDTRGYQIIRYNKADEVAKVDDAQSFLSKVEKEHRIPKHLGSNPGVICPDSVMNTIVSGDDDLDFTGIWMFEKGKGVELLVKWSSSDSYNLRELYQCFREFKQYTQCVVCIYCRS